MKTSDEQIRGFYMEETEFGNRFFFMDPYDGSTKEFINEAEYLQAMLRVMRGQDLIEHTIIN